MTQLRRSRRQSPRFTAARRVRRIMQPERLEQRQLLAGDGISGLLASNAPPYQNPFVPQDVDSNGLITPQDALMVINELNANGSHSLTASGGGEGEDDKPRMIDVNGNNMVEPSDALIVINALNGGEGEGELVGYTLRATDMDGNPITSIQVGNLFKLTMHVQDRRMFPLRPNGVFAGYLDVAHTNSDLFEIFYGETQRIQLSDDTTGGSYTLTLNGETTAPINAGFSPGPIMNALNALPSVEPGDVVVTFNGGEDEDFFVWDVYFTNNFAEQDVPTMLIDDSNLLGTAEVTELFPADPTNDGTFRNAFTTGALYENGKSAFRDPGEFSEVGAFDGLDEFDPPDIEYLLWEVTLRALDDGSVTFTPNAPEDSASATLVFGSDDAVPENMIDFGAPITLDLVRDVTAMDDQFTVAEDSGANMLDVLANDFSLNDVKQLAAVGDAANGTVSISGGMAVYTPDADFFGTDTFTYTLSNGSGGTSVGNVSLTVQPAPDDPIARDDTASYNEDSTGNFASVLGNDTDPDGDDLTVIAVTQGSAGGTVTIGTGGDFAFYTPAPDFFGTETFTYTVSDSTGRTDTATVTVTINNEPDDPTANDDTASVLEDSSGNTVNVLGNDTDPDGDALTITAVSQGSDGGTVAIGSGGSVALYTPAANFVGTETFTYTISDSTGRTDTATVTITVENQPDAPVAVDDNLTVDEASMDNTLELLANDTDIDGDSLTIVALGPLDNGGSAEIDPGGLTVSYTPDPQLLQGTETFTYTIQDSTGMTDTATVTISIIPAIRPRAVRDDYTIPEDSAATTLDVLANDIPNDGAQATLLSVSTATNGTVTIDDQGTPELTDDRLVYTPDPDFFGTETFTYTINDTSGLGDDSTATVRITVTAVNDAPTVTVPGDQLVDEDMTLTLDQGFSVDDPDGNVQVVVQLSVGNGTLLVVDAGEAMVDDNDSAAVTLTGTVDQVNGALGGGLSYTPDQDYAGGDTLTVSVNDQGNTGAGGPLSDSDTVGITISPINDAPVNNLPGQQVTPQDVDLVFSTAGGNGISITDVDAADGTVSLDLSVVDGNLTLGSTSGLDVTGDGTGSISASGTLAALNAALEGLTFRSDAGFEGMTDLSMSVNDNGNTGAGDPLSDSDALTIVVTGINNPPVINAPATAMTDEDVDLVFDNVSVTDVDAGSADVSIELTAFNGILTLSGTAGLDVTGDGTESVSATGSVADINAALNGLTFSPTPNNFGHASIDIHVDDLGNTGEGGSQTDDHQIAVTINSVNDPPTAVDDSFSLIAQTGAAILDLLANDSFAPDPDEQLQIIAVDTAGTQGTVTIAGDGSNVSYEPAENADETDTFTYTISDGNGGTDTATVTVEVLSFLPSTFSGYVYFDADSNGDRSTGERGLAGVEVLLTGTDFQGNQVSVETLTEADGSYIFGDDPENPIAPGTYVLRATQAENMLDGADDVGSFSATRVANDEFEFVIPQEGGVNSTDNNFGERGLTAPFLSLGGLLASQQGDDSRAATGIMLAVHASGELMWYANGDGWDGYSVVDYTEQDGVATITLRSDDGSLMQMSLEVDSENLRSRQSGGQKIVNVLGTAGDYDMDMLDS